MIHYIYLFVIFCVLYLFKLCQTFYKICFLPIYLGSSWRIHMSEVTRNKLAAAGGYSIEPRGPIEIKGKGMMNTYWLLGKKGFDKHLPNPPPIG